MPSIQIVQSPIEQQGYRPNQKFNETYGLPELPKVMTKIKPIPEEDANSEIERGEIVLDPETGAMHKALGKPHSQGGTPTNLKENSFIFSNFKNLAITPKQKELFQFKMGGKKMINNTPAKVLSREVDLEHHNKMVDVIQNTKKYDALTNNAAKLMMMKNLEKAGQVAYLQESKKGEQTPDFAKDTAPVFSADVDNKIKQSMQYLQEGGSIWGKISNNLRGNGTIPPAPGNFYVYGPNGEILKEVDSSGKLVKDFGVTLPNESNKQLSNQQGRQDRYAGIRPPYPNTWKNYYDNSEKKQYSAPDWIDPKTFYAVPGMVDYMKTLDKIPGVDNDLHKPDDAWWGHRHQIALEKFFPNGNPNVLTQRMPPAVIDTSLNPAKAGIDQVNTRQPKGSPFLTGNNPGDLTGITDRTNYNTQLTPWQKLTMMRPFFEAAKVRTQYPIRQHQESVIPQLQNVNAQPMLDSNNQTYFNAANTLRTLDPTSASAYMQQLYGNRIGENNKVLGSVQNQNVGIQNRQSEITADSLNKDALANRQFDSRFYDQTQMTVKNAADLKEAYTTQGIQGVNDVMSKKLSFDSWLNTQQQYRGNKIFVDKDGVQHYQGVTPYTPNPGFFGYSVKYNPTNIDWNTYQKSQSKVDTGKDLMELYNTLKEADPTFKMSDLTKFKAIQSYITNPNNDVPPLTGFKLGGKFRNVRRMK